MCSPVCSTSANGAKSIIGDVRAATFPVRRSINFSPDNATILPAYGQKFSAHHGINGFDDKRRLVFGATDAACVFVQNINVLTGGQCAAVNTRERQKNESIGVDVLATLRVDFVDTFRFDLNAKKFFSTSSSVKAPFLNPTLKFADSAFLELLKLAICCFSTANNFDTKTTTAESVSIEPTTILVNLATFSYRKDREFFPVKFGPTRAVRSKRPKNFFANGRFLTPNFGKIVDSESPSVDRAGENYVSRTRVEI
uniref:Uncharacterized protein n=1 Tax=Romanomermis culicivorax TaxID=13658 RepID=A0A915K4Z2_ROMCU